MQVTVQAHFSQLIVQFNTLPLRLHALDNTSRDPHESEDDRLKHSSKLALSNHLIQHATC